MIIMEDSETLFCSSEFPCTYMRKNSFEIYRQFGQASSKMFASPAIGTEDFECHSYSSWLFSFVPKGGYSFDLVTGL
jgi:hypothetical protein